MRTDDMSIKREDALYARLDIAIAECNILRAENERLREALRFARRILGANECGTDDVLEQIDAVLDELGEDT